jgi:signal transduction histidine kinase
VYEVSRVPLHEVVHAVAPMLSPQSEDKRLQLKIGQCPATAIAVADRPKVEQIMLNLLSNAVKFTGTGGEIELSCGETGERAWLKVRDTGIGIPADQIEAIFAPFVQVGRSLANPKAGAGLGLAISRELARAMHGDLTVESSEAAGSSDTRGSRRFKAKHSVPPIAAGVIATVGCVPDRQGYPEMGLRQSLGT